MQQLPTIRNSFSFAIRFFLLASLVLIHSTANAGDFWECFNSTCHPAAQACSQSVCPPSSSGSCSSRGCGDIYDFKWSACGGWMCPTVTSLADDDPCSEVLKQTAMGCFGGCWSKDENEASSCSRACKTTAQGSYKACQARIAKGEDAVTVRNELLMHVKQPKPKKIFFVGKVNNKSFFERRIDNAKRGFDHVFGKYDMATASENATFYTGLWTAGAFAAGTMTLGTSVIIVGGVTLVASSLDNFVKASSETLDVGQAAAKGVREGTLDASTSVVIDLATGKVIGWVGKSGKVILRSSRPAAKAIGKFAAKSRMGAATVSLIDDGIKLGRKAAKSNLADRVLVTKLDDEGLKHLTRMDAFMEGIETGTGNSVSGLVQSWTTEEYETYMKKPGKLRNNTPPPKSSMLIRYASRPFQ
ncbi:hypothetical protein F3F96_00025 [Mariprofundus sp. NF]|uniref:hypothetical protein n=1 Tax=Mariprofundus sp. NF TaxID=2608716 RepID=UPI0015A07C0B|nr:hypothetical protein [Mariprofundus sp. NF]NWF37526.1 hypothetical protein [Mariprofundus sp. NF]